MSDGSELHRPSRSMRLRCCNGKAGEDGGGACGVKSEEAWGEVETLEEGAHGSGPGAASGIKGRAFGWF